MSSFDLVEEFLMILCDELEESEYHIFAGHYKDVDDLKELCGACLRVSETTEDKELSKKILSFHSELTRVISVKNEIDVMCN